MCLHVNVMGTCPYKLSNGPFVSVCFHFKPLNHSNPTNKSCFNSNMSSYIFYTSKIVLKHSNHSSKIYFTSTVPYILQLLNLKDLTSRHILWHSNHSHNVSFIPSVIYTLKYLKSNFYTSKQSKNIFFILIHLEWFQTSHTIFKSHN